MKESCSYEEYKSFFEDLMQKAAIVSDNDLAQVAGGAFHLKLKDIMAPIAIATMMTGIGAISASANSEKIPVTNPAPASGPSAATSTQAPNPSAAKSVNLIEDLMSKNVLFGAGSTFWLLGYDNIKSATENMINSFDVGDLLSYIKVKNNNQNNVNDGDITISVLSGVKNIKLRGNVRLMFDPDYPSQVESIDATNSSRYIVEQDAKFIKLYEKTKGGKGKLENIIMVPSSGDKYRFYYDAEHKIANITFDSKTTDLSEIPDDILQYSKETTITFNSKTTDLSKIPDDISRFGKLNIKIDENVESLILDEKHGVDLSAVAKQNKVDFKKLKKYKIDVGKAKNCKEVVVKKAMGNFTIEYNTKDDQFLVYSDQKAPQDVKIPESLENTNKRIKVGKGIKSLTTSSSKPNLDLSEACDLKDIKSLSESVEYPKEANVIYKIEHENTKEIKTPIKLLRPTSGARYGLDFSIKKSKDNANPEKFISISKNIYDLSNLENVKIPKNILDLNKKYFGNAPFKVNPGIQSVVLQGDERLDLTNATDLIYVNTTNSSVYCLKDYGMALYEKSTNGGNDKLVKLLKQSGVVNGIRFKFNKLGTGGYWDLSGDEYEKNPIDAKLLKNVEIPDELRKYSSIFVIGKGIESIILKDIDLISSSITGNNLKDVDIKNSNMYEKDKDEIAIYQKSIDASGNVIRNFFKLLKQSGNIKNVQFSIICDELTKAPTEVHLYGNAQNEPLDKVEIPASLMELASKTHAGKVFIDSGIKSIVLGKNDSVDLSRAHDLESINTDASDKYEVKESDGFSKLYEKDQNTGLNLIGSCRKIKTDGNVKCCMLPDRTVFVRAKNPNSTVENLDLKIQNLYDSDLYNKSKSNNNKFIVGPGIKSITIHGDDIVNLTEATNLENVTLDNSKRYSVDSQRIALWENVKDNTGKIISQTLVKILKHKGTIGNVDFSIDESKKEILLSNNNKRNLLTNFTIPANFGNFTKSGFTFSIGSGIESIVLNGNELVNLSKAADLERVDAKSSNMYSTDPDGIILYDSNGINIKAYVLKINGANLYLLNNQFYVPTLPFSKPYNAKIESSGSFVKDLKIPKALKDSCQYVFIGRGIESISDLCDEDINIDSALDLKSIKLKNDPKCKYMINNGRLIYGGRDLGKIDKGAIYKFCFDRIGEFDRNEKNMTKPDDLNNNMKYSVKLPDNSFKHYTVNEQKTYEKIKQLVEELKEKVKLRTPKEGMSEKKIKEGFSKYEGEGIDRVRTERGDISRNYKMNEQWRIAKAIYRWVAKNIKYDDESLVEGYRKSQDPFFVFENRAGVCQGKASLTALMMEMAGIPSKIIGTLPEPGQGPTHAYTAIYLPENKGGYYDDSGEFVDNSKDAGWALIDATWGAPDASKDPTNLSNQQNLNSKLAENANSGLSGANAQKIKKYFSAFYNNKSIQDSNQNLLSQEHHIIFRLVSLSDNPSSSQPYDSLSMHNMFNDKNNEIRYFLKGSTSSPIIQIYGKVGGTKNIVQLPSSFLGYDYSINVNRGIEKLKLSDDQVKKVDFGPTSQIKELILSTPKSKYTKNDFAIYERDSKGNKGKLVKIFNHDTIADASGLKYVIFDKFIGLEGNDGKDGNKKMTHLDISKLPQDLKNLGLPFWIYGGFETISVPQDFDLDNLLFYSDQSAQKINIPDKFTWHGKIWDKSTKNPSTPKDLMTIKPGLMYRLIYSSESNSHNIALYSVNRNVKSLNIDTDIPQFLKNIHRNPFLPFAPLSINFSISSGIESVIGSENEINNLKFESDSNVKNIDITSIASSPSTSLPDFNQYTKDGVALYQNDKLLYTYNKGKNIAENGLKYKIHKHFIKVDYSDAKKELDMSKDVPDNLKKLNLPFLIGNGFKKVTLDDGQKVLFDQSCKLRKANIHVANESKKYKITDDGLYTQNDGADNEFGCQLLNFKGEYNNLSSGVKYQIYSDSISDYIKLIGDEKSKNKLDINQDIPLYLMDTNMELKVSKGFTSCRWTDQKTIDFLDDSHVTNIDLGKNSSYTKDNIAVYSYAQPVIYNRGINIAKTGIKYQICHDRIKISAGYAKKDLNMSTDMPDDLKKFNLPFEIESGFKNVTLNDNYNVIFSKGFELKKGNLKFKNGLSEKYVIKDDGLYQKSDGKKAETMMFKFKTDVK